jgi:hypothetical protein
VAIYLFQRPGRLRYPGTANCSRIVRTITAFVLLPLVQNLSAQTGLVHQAYVWQRTWGPPLREALSAHAKELSGLIVLKAEVKWMKEQPHVVQVPVDWQLLSGLGRPIGLALRIGPFAGPFSTNDAPGSFLRELANSLLMEARSNHLSPYELQVDFDCAESKLDGYRLWVEDIRRKIAPTPLTITTLPSWLKQSAFKALISASDGYVLQVHSLVRPTSLSAPFTLCDPTLALSAVRRASDFDVPFRVALPTYGYLLAFDSSGRFIGLSAEGPRRDWPAGTSLREVRSDPVELAGLVQAWSTNRPSRTDRDNSTSFKSPMKGIIWYRFPVADDIFNWRWKTLSAMLAARSPRQSLRAEPRRVESGLVEIILENDGELDTSSRLAIEVRWSSESGMRLPAGDGLGGFELVDAESSMARFVNRAQRFHLAAGEKCVIGWLRFEEDREVQVEIKNPSDVLPTPKK